MAAVPPCRDEMIELCNYRGSWLHWICGESCHCRDLQWTPACHGFWCMSCDHVHVNLKPGKCLIFTGIRDLLDPKKDNLKIHEDKVALATSTTLEPFFRGNDIATMPCKWSRPEVSSSERSLRPMWGLVPTRYWKMNAFEMLDCRLSTNNLSIGFLNNDAWVATANMKHIASMNEVGAGDIWHHVSRLNGTWMWEENFPSGWHTIVSENLCSTAPLFELQNSGKWANTIALWPRPIWTNIRPGGSVKDSQDSKVSVLVGFFAARSHLIFMLTIEQKNLHDRSLKAKPCHGYYDYERA